MTRTTRLLAIGFAFFALALMGMAYLALPEGPEERSSATQQIPGATLQPPTPSTCVPPVGWSTHIVQPGETLSKIAFDAGTTLPELLAANCQIGNANQIYPGQGIYVPPSPLLTPQPIITPQPSPTSSLQPYGVEAEWPAQMKTQHSSTIRVSLLRTSDGYVPTVEFEGNTAFLSTPIPVGTLGVEPRSAFGNEYKAYAVAHLEGTSFDIKLASPETQSLDQQRVDWKWNIKPIDAGLQSIDGYIEIEWKPVDNAGASVRRQIWSYHFEIKVVQPIISRGQVSVLSLVSGFVGSGLSVPWLYEIYNKRRTQQRRKNRKRT